MVYQTFGIYNQKIIYEFQNLTIEVLLHILTKKKFPFIS